MLLTLILKSKKTFINTCLTNITPVRHSDEFKGELAVGWGCPRLVLAIFSASRLFPRKTRIVQYMQ